MARIPRDLLRKRNELARELAIHEGRVSELSSMVAAADAAILLFDRHWKAAKAPARRLPKHRGWLPPGEAARASLRALKRAPEALTTADIVSAIASERKLEFPTRQDREDFASSITMAMRRYEAKGIVTSSKVNGANKLACRINAV